MPTVSDILTKDEFSTQMPATVQGTIAVAVSGGADSLCLALLLKEWIKSPDDIVALTVDHKLRPDSTTEAQQVGQWMKHHGISHHILTVEWEGAQPTARIQEQARKKRYNLLRNWCHKNNITVLATAHHLDDQVETFLMRLEAGSGLDGLTVMRTTSMQEDLTILRPLLTFPKDRLIQTLRERFHQEWAEDPTNTTQKYARGRLRNVLEAIENKRNIAEMINLTVNKLQHSLDCLEDLTNNALEDIAQFHPLAYITVKQEKLNALHPEIQRRLLRKVMSSLTQTKYPIRHRSLEQLIENLRNDETTVTCGGCVFSKKADQLYVVREMKNLPNPVALSDNERISWDRRFELEVQDLPKTQVFTIAPLGKRHVPWKTIKKNFPDIPCEVVMPSLPAIFSKDGLVAFPHAHYFSGNLIQPCNIVQWRLNISATFDQLVLAL
jgi:tRNA(Ile)-lysidine synthase